MPAPNKHNHFNFTKASLAACKAPAEGRTYFYDTKRPGLAVCVTATGHRSFLLYKKVNKRPERLKIGDCDQLTVEQARDAAARLLGEIAGGKNPADRGRVNRQAPTLGEVFDEFIGSPSRGKAKRPRSPKTTAEYCRQFKANLPHWRNRQLSQIKRADIQKLHNHLGEQHGFYLANRVLALVKAIFNYAIEQEYFDTNPASRIKAFEEQSRERFLQADELPRFWKAIEARPMADYFKLSLLTGARQQNILQMKWEDVDLQAAVWQIPHTKNGTPQTLPLPPMAVAILRQRKEASCSDWVFPGTNGRDFAAPPKNSWKRLCEAAGLNGLRMHDLRRSLGSWLAMNGTSLTVIGKALNQTSVQVTTTYARVDLETVRTSIESATDAILAATKSET